MKETKSKISWRSHSDRPDIVIDVHAHVGRAKKKRLGRKWLGNGWLGTDDLSHVLDRAASVGVDLSIVSHIHAVLWPRELGESSNRKLLKACENRKDALMWWVVDPRSKKSMELFRQHSRHPKVVGMKIGPTYHNYRFKDHARALLDLAMETDAAILTHSGEPNDMPADIVRCINHYPEVRFIMAHFGNCLEYRGHLEALKKCASPRCFVDTSSIVSMVCDHIEKGVQELGVSRFLFGTDTPLYSTAAQYARILEADLSPSQKKAILGNNARTLLLKK